MIEQEERDKLATQGQALHLGCNEPPTLALMCSNRSSGQNRYISAERLWVQGHKEKWGRHFQSLQVAWEMRDNSPHKDGHSGTVTVEQWTLFPKRPDGFPLLGYRNRRVFFLTLPLL